MEFSVAHDAVREPPPSGVRSRRGRRMAFGALGLGAMMTVGTGTWWTFRPSSDELRIHRVAAVAGESQVMGQLTLTVPRAGIPAGLTVDVAAQAFPIVAGTTDVPEQHLGGQYLLQPAQTRLTEPATVQISFTEEGRRGLDASDARLAYWVADHWEPLDGSYDPSTRTVTASVTWFGPSILAVVPSSALSATNTRRVIRAQDRDGDGLRDSEEAFYGTDPATGDTDGDGYADGLEVHEGYNPLGAGTFTQ